MKHVAALALVALACASEVRSPEAPDPVAAPGGGVPSVPAMTLTSRAPRSELPIPPLTAAPGVLALEIERIHNPSLQSFSVAAGVTWSAPGAASVEESLGGVTPYPADQPGTFLLSVPSAARELLTRRTGRLALRLSLLPIADDRKLVEPLEVTFGESRWR